MKEISQGRLTYGGIQRSQVVTPPPFCPASLWGSSSRSQPSALSSGHGVPWEQLQLWVQMLTLLLRLHP